MKHTARMTTAARLGRWLGGVWGGCLRAERRVHQWLMAQGLPAGGARVLIWVVKLATLGVLLYVSVWAALLLVALAVAARMAEQAPQGPIVFKRPAFRKVQFVLIHFQKDVEKLVRITPVERFR